MGKWDRRHGRGSRGSSDRNAESRKGGESTLPIGAADGVADGPELQFEGGSGSNAAAATTVTATDPIRLTTRICLWEFGQNDPKR